MAIHDNFSSCWHMRWPIHKLNPFETVKLNCSSTRWRISKTEITLSRRCATEEKRDVLRATQERFIGGIANGSVHAKRIEANRAHYSTRWKQKKRKNLPKASGWKTIEEQTVWNWSWNSFETAEERAARLAERALKLKADRAARMKKASEDALRQFRNFDELRGKR